MNAIRGSAYRKTTCAVTLVMVMLLTGLLVTACSPASPPPPPPGPMTKATYIYQAPQGYVEVLTLRYASSLTSSVTGSLSDVYNCGNGEEGTALSPIKVSGTVTISSSSDFILHFSGVSGQYTGWISRQPVPDGGGNTAQPATTGSGTLPPGAITGPAAFVLIDPAGATTTFQPVSGNSLSNAVSQEQPAKCLELQQTNAP